MCDGVSNLVLRSTYGGESGWAVGVAIIGRLEMIILYENWEHLRSDLKIFIHFHILDFAREVALLCIHGGPDNVRRFYSSHPCRDSAMYAYQG